MLASGNWLILAAVLAAQDRRRAATTAQDRCSADRIWTEFTMALATRGWFGCRLVATRRLRRRPHPGRMRLYASNRRPPYSRSTQPRCSAGYTIRADLERRVAAAVGSRVPLDRADGARRLQGCQGERGLAKARRGRHAGTRRDGPPPRSDRLVDRTGRRRLGLLLSLSGPCADIIALATKQRPYAAHAASLLSRGLGGESVTGRGGGGSRSCRTLRGPKKRRYSRVVLALSGARTPAAARA